MSANNSGGINDSLLGIVYQTKIFSMHAYVGKSKDWDFKLETEVKNAGMS
jgi:hypothetical protein